MREQHLNSGEQDLFDNLHLVELAIKHLPNPKDKFSYEEQGDYNDRLATLHLAGYMIATRAGRPHLASTYKEDAQLEKPDRVGEFDKLSPDGQLEFLFMNVSVHRTDFQLPTLLASMISDRTLSKNCLSRIPAIPHEPQRRRNGITKPGLSPTSFPPKYKYIF